MIMKILKLNLIAVLAWAAEPISRAKEWYVRHRYACRLLLLLILTSTLIVSILVDTSARKEAERQAEMQRIAERVDALLHTEPIPEEIPQQYIEEAELLARVIYGIRDNSEDDMRTHIWCIFNRVDIKTGEFARVNTLEAAVSKPGQWIFFETSYDYPVVESLYQLALAEVRTWHDGHRPCAPDYVYEEWSPDEIVLRSTWEYEKNTKTWRYGE